MVRDHDSAHNLKEANLVSKHQVSSQNLPDSYLVIKHLYLYKLSLTDFFQFAAFSHICSFGVTKVRVGVFPRGQIFTASALLLCPSEVCLSVTNTQPAKYL